MLQLWQYNKRYTRCSFTREAVHTEKFAFWEKQKSFIMVLHLIPFIKVQADIETKPTDT